MAGTPYRLLQYAMERGYVTVGDLPSWTLALEQRLGVNPYRFGMIGSTDAHTGLAAVQENNFFGKHSGVEPSPGRATHLVGRAGSQAVQGWQQASSGYAAVWARENTRESLWDALRRREVYATTGSRMTVRFFGGWNFEPGDGQTPDLASAGYRRGVPMGAVLPEVLPRMYSVGPRVERVTIRWSLVATTSVPP